MMDRLFQLIFLPQSSYAFSAVAIAMTVSLLYGNWVLGCIFLLVGAFGIPYFEDIATSNYTQELIYKGYIKYNDESDNE